jgi:diaminohydroxyphosphoribosylaminopyrimidine deaminase/5-amino-6-(5-phosphoribosylamino)uracil reductase
MNIKKDENYLRECLAQAEKNLGFCAPNPSVGAIVVKDHQTIAQGSHDCPGAAHAEVAALNQLTQEQAQGATLYVSLEPCNHYGRTPPCTNLIIEKKLARVVFSFRDPNPNVCGNGQQRLLDAGIICDYIPLAEVENFYQSYAWYCAHKQPFVTAKIALSLNGKIAGINGQRVAITGKDIQQWVHQQRLQNDAILTTAKTIIQDDPYFTIRLTDTSITKPIYILDRKLQTPLTAKIFHTGAKLNFFYESNEPEKIDQLVKKGASCFQLPTQNNQFNLTEVLDRIGQEGCHHLWLEAGGRCLQNFVAAKLVNKAYLAIGLKWLEPQAQDAFSQDIFSAIKSKRWFSVGDEVICEVIFGG